MIDKQIRSAIAELNSSDSKAALLKLEALKLQRLHAVRPKTYDRILASLR
jgi:hypothetical protein